jgi:transposase InsO family protein
LITRFGVPSVLVFDNAAYFSSTLLTEFALDKGIMIKYSANYYPQGNGVAESTNKNLVRILKKTVTDNQRNWHNQLHNALWVNRVMHPRKLSGIPHTFWSTEQEAILPNGLYLPSLQLAQDSNEEPSSDHATEDRHSAHAGRIERKG